MKYDYLVVGAGLFGATFARAATDSGKKCLVIDRRKHLAGNCFDERKEGILVNAFGGHIFHTNSRSIWDFVNRFAAFSRYEHRVKVNYQGELYSFPINLQTFRQLGWGDTAEEVKARLDQVRVPHPRPNSFAQHVLSSVGPELYEIFFEGYTAKQWNRSPHDLPATIAKRIPIRLTEDDRYFDDRFQGMPTEGYTEMVRRMLEGIEVQLSHDYVLGDYFWPTKRDGMKTIYSGPLDELFDYRFGPLEYRSLRFEHETHEGDFQGEATVNYTEQDVPYTRIIEWKHFRPEQSRRTTTTHITREYPASTGDPYYPVTDVKNNVLYKKYQALVPDWMLVGGRLGSFQYLNMDQAIGMALKDAKRELS
jgi:UDP-galactopyranose mutase